MLKRILVFAIILQVVSLVLLVYQTLSTSFFLSLPGLTWQQREILELLAILGIVAGSTVTLLMLRMVERRNQRVEEQLAVAAGMFQEFVQEKYREWGLSSSERDVATLIIKGFSIAEIAAIRNTSIGTIKSQNTAIYRKSGLSGKSQFISYFLEELTATL